MEFEDSRKALFVEPNAYIQKHDNKKETKKIVFQEPYECLPNYYINNNFEKGGCKCVAKNQHTLDCEQKPKDLNNDCKNNTQNGCAPKQNNFGFDLKNLMPLLGLFNKSGGADLSQFVGLMKNSDASNGGFNPMNLLSGLLSNKDGLRSVLNLFKGGGLSLFGKKSTIKKEIKSTDFEIKNYTRVE